MGVRVDSDEHVIERVGPTFGSEPAVVEVEPTDDGANVERAADGVKLVVGSEHLCACVGR